MHITITDNWSKMNSLPKLPTIHNSRGQAGQQSLQSQLYCKLEQKTCSSCRSKQTHTTHWLQLHHNNYDAELKTIQKEFGTDKISCRGWKKRILLYVVCTVLINALLQWTSSVNKHIILKHIISFAILSLLAVLIDTYKGRLSCGLTRRLLLYTLLSVGETTAL